MKIAFQMPTILPTAKHIFSTPQFPVLTQTCTVALYNANNSMPTDT